jgi:hypothetical protein
MHVWNTKEMCTKFCSEILKERVHLKDLGIAERIILEWVL